jgi:hypothetical protein
MGEATPIVVAVVLAVVAGALPGFAEGQQGVETAAGDSRELVFEREVFSYPQYDRRNPFRPLTGDETGPRFENLVLMGRILSAAPGGSVALVGARPPGSTRLQGPVQTYRLRVGDVIGNSRILEIRESMIVVEVEEFGLFEVRTLELVRTAPRVAPPPSGTVPVDPGPAPSPDGQSETGPAPAGPVSAVPGQVGARARVEGMLGDADGTANGGWA